MIRSIRKSSRKVNNPKIGNPFTPRKMKNRYFKGIGESSGATWRWDGDAMFQSQDGGEETSIFTGPAELLECLDVIETDESGEPLQPTAEDIAAERGDHEQQIEADMS